MSKYQCNDCGEADSEHFSIPCYVEPYAGAPTRCPISGEECEWEKVEDKDYGKL